MQFLVWATLCLTALFAGQETASVPGMKKPAGMVASDGKLYVADRAARLIWVGSTQAKEFQVFVNDERFKEPTGVTADGQAIYVADPKARAVFRVDKNTRKVTPLWTGESLASPVDLVYFPSYRIEGRQIKRTNELFILGEDSRSAYRFALDDTHYEPRALEWGEFKEPSSLYRAGHRLFLADRGAKTIFEWSSRGDWSNVLAAGARSEPPSREAFFHQLKEPKNAAYWRDIYYVIDGAEIYALVDRGTHAVPLVYQEAVVKGPSHLMVAEENLLISDEELGRVVVWPLLIPITIEIEVQKDTSDVLGAIYLYLWNKGTLPLVKLKLPYQYGKGESCTTVDCLIEKARGLLPKTNAALEEILCKANSEYCSKAGRFVRLPPGKEFFFPLVPYEKHLYVASRTLDGRSSVRALLDYWIPDPVLRAQATEEFLRSLNPQLAAPDILSFRKKGAKIRIPIQRNRYYVAVPRAELFSEESDLFGIAKKDPRLTIRSTEAPTLKAWIEAPQGGDTLKSAEDLRADYRIILANMDYREDRRSYYGDGADATVLVCESFVECGHPVFFDVSGSGAFPTSNCGSRLGALEGVILQWEKTESADVRHGTCVASLIGSRVIPYGQVTVAPGSELLWSPCSNIPENIEGAYLLHNAAFVVNLSSGSHEATAEQTWKNDLGNYWSQFALFVAAAGNEYALLRKKIEYPALLARDFPNVISVGALNREGKSIWQQGKEGSNYGREVEILAPGEAVPCAMNMMEEKAVYTRATGTSMATPLVSAVASLLLKKNLTPGEIKARLLATAEPLDEFEEDENREKKEPVALFGKLSVERALKNPGYVHVAFDRPEAAKEGPEWDEGTFQPGKEWGIKFELKGSRGPTWVHSSDVLSIKRRQGDPYELPRYRMVYFDDRHKRVELIDNVRLNGCLPYVPRKGNKVRLLFFGGGCEQLQGDSSEIVTNVVDLIGPRLGADRFLTGR